MVKPLFILQSFSNTLTDFLLNIRIVDILDIAIITFFLYIVLNWLRQSASRRSLLSFGLLIAVYVLARVTGMYLTERLLEGLFLVILIGFVVVFQSDMRRIIDRLGSWSFFKKTSSNSPLDIVTNILTEACAKMAEQRRGALIAIKGSEAWDRHLHGGIELGGVVTIPLLHSIFNTKAPGHDGAVLLEGRKIMKFGVHLPLSIHLDKMSKGGTRHTAALGLAEQCDALIVVVSEERGEISIARDGQIRELESHSDLKKHLDEFWNTHYKSGSPTFTQWWKRRSLLTAAASVVLAFILWLTFAYPSGTVFRSYSMPIEFRNLHSSNITLQDSVPSSVLVTLSGSEQAFQTFNPSNTVISFDLATQKSDSGKLRITKDRINLPNDLHFVEASPPTLNLKAENLSRRKLPVKITTTGHLPAGLELVSIVSTPKSVNVLMDSTIKNIDSISTDPVDLGKIQSSTTLQKRLLPKKDTLKVPEDESTQVLIKVSVKKSGQ